MVRYSHSGSFKDFKVIEIGTSWQPICDFLLVTHGNINHVSLFRDIAMKGSEIAVFIHPSLV